MAITCGKYCYGSHYCRRNPKRKQDVFLTILTKQEQATSVEGKMANVRDSDTSLWLHNKLGTSNDSWISGSICSQLNKEVLRNIKECFPDLQTQVKLKLLLSFFHIPRRLVEEWKAELDEVIEVAGLDTELWVSMLAETMKTFPATSSLNTEISDYEDTRPIFTDMVNDLRKLVSKHSDLGMLPLECQYLNKNALISVVGQQQNPVKHFTLKRKPKSANLRTELLHKSADAQSSLKKASAPTIPLRSRGMPRKMTDTTPLKGIPSRVPTSGFRSPNVASSQQRPNLSRTPAGRKDGGIKLIEFTDQPLGYAAAKKRKRQQELEEQQKKQEQKQNAVSANSSTSPSASPTISAVASLASGIATTPTANNSTFEIKSETPVNHLDDSHVDNKDEITLGPTQIESSTPEYKPTLTYAQQAAIDSDNLDDSKAHAKLLIAASNHQSSGAGSKLTTITTLPNNTNTTPIKKIKQEIEIKSEEILVPATIKVEKIDQPTSQLIHKTPLQQSINPRIQQHVIIQQQPQQQPTQHVVIRTASQQQKQTLGSGVTLTPTQRAPETIKLETIDIKPLTKPVTTPDLASQSTTLTQQQLRQAANPLANLPNNISVKITSTKATKQQPQQKSQQQQPILINSSTPVILATSNQPLSRKNQITVTNSSTSTPTTQSIKSMPLSQLKSATNSGPVIISQTIIQPAKRAPANNSAGILQPSSATVTSTLSQQNQQQQLQQQQPTQYILTSTTPQLHSQQQQNPTMPSLTSFAQVRSTQQPSLYQTTSTTTGASTQTPTKIVLKTTPTSTVMMTPVRQQVSNIGNPPPLISTSSGTQQNTLQSLQNVQLPNRQVTIQPASQAAQQQHLQAQLQQQQQKQHNPQLQQQQHTVVSNTTATQQPKLTQVVMQPTQNSGNVGGNVKNKTIILTQKGVILRNIGGDMYQQIPISNVSGLQNIGTGTTLMTTAAGPPGLVKSTSSNVQPQQTIQIQQQPTASTTLVKQQLPTLIPTNNLSTMTQQHVLVQQQPQQQTMQTIISNPSQQTIIRPVMTNVQSGLTTLPQGLTLIQRPGQQPQLVQVQTAPSGQQQTQIHRTIITQPQQQQKVSSLQQMRPQQIILQHKTPQQRIITTPSSTASSVGGQTQQIQIQQNNNLTRGTQILQVQQQFQQQQQQQPTQQEVPQRKGLCLSIEHAHKAHEMFRKANRVSRPDKALILGFMAGQRENPLPNPENVIVIKLGDSEEKVQQEDGSTALCLVEKLIRLDYNTGEWKTFQNYRRIDQSSQGQGVDAGTVMQAHNSVVI